jgi:hypothetical protein
VKKTANAGRKIEPITCEDVSGRLSNPCKILELIFSVDADRSRERESKTEQRDKGRSGGGN